MQNRQYKRILFLCTGNYYRSRFAEELFNRRAGCVAPGWRASSRALAIERGAENVGPISEFTVRALADMDIVLAPPIRFPIACTVQDLKRADLVIAMKESEHRPLIRKFRRLGGACDVLECPRSGRGGFRRDDQTDWGPGGWADFVNPGKAGV